MLKISEKSVSHNTDKVKFHMTSRSLFPSPFLRQPVLYLCWIYYKIYSPVYVCIEISDWKPKYSCPPNTVCTSVEPISFSVTAAECFGIPQSLIASPLDCWHRSHEHLLTGSSADTRPEFSRTDTTSGVYQSGLAEALPPRSLFAIGHFKTFFNFANTIT